MSEPLHHDEAETIARYMTPAQVEGVRRVMREVFFARLSAEFMATPEGQAALHQQTTRRFYECVRFIMPWITRHIDLSRGTVVEVGSGAGASTAAFAYQCAQVHGYDIEEHAVHAARARFEAMGLKNATAECAGPAELLGLVRSRFAGGVDAVFLYAVLEHETFAECQETLKTCWDVLRPGGVLIVADTPNRLTYTDKHTAWLPFYHMLPAEVAMAYASKSPRPSFPASIAQAQAVSDANAREILTRWGRGVSYHEFELALGELRELVVGDGFDEEVRGLKPVTLEEKLLYAYAKGVGLDVPAAFWRESVDVILRKPGGGAATPKQSRDLSALMQL